MPLKLLWLLSALVNFVGCDVNSAYPQLSENSKVLHETTTYKYPTATWSATSYEQKKYSIEGAKLYLFKPSPFLKPPFTEGEIGESITSIEDGVNVSGRRKAYPKWKQEKSKNSIQKQVPTVIKERNSHLLDKFLEESLRKYVKSANLTDEFGTISIETFSEALRRITEGRRNKPYDENRELRLKFREEVLAPKKIETTTPSGLLERQYQKRLKKTWEIIHDNIAMSTEDYNSSGNSKFYNYEEASASILPANNLQSFVKNMENSSYEVENNEEESNSLPHEGSIGFTTLGSVVSRAFEYSTEPFIRPDSMEPTTFRPITNIVNLKKKNYKVDRGKKKYKDALPKEQKVQMWNNGEVQLSVAETVYYRPRQTPIETFTYQKEHEFGSIPGEPEKDYPMLSSPPSTGFKCPQLNGQGPKMMADRKARCQVFYICTGEGPPAPMLCPNGTMFNENVLVCDWWFNVAC